MTKTKTDIIDGEHAIAIVGVGAKMPGALSAPAFWENIRNGVYAIQDVPQERWDPTLYWDPDPDAPDKTYSKIGGWVTDFSFDRKAFRMPPMVVDKTDPTQLLCLEAVREALEDSGYDERDFDRERCAVILGNALGGDLRDQTNLRIQYAEVDAAMRAALLELSIGRLDASDVEELLGRVEEQVKSKITGINEDSMPGELANIIAGRVAQAFDLRGPNYVCDAACASTLAAMESAIYGLRSHEFDMAVTGGADRSMGPPSYVKFSKIGALSPDGSRPFDAGANGFVMGEGAGIIILKRLSDAIEDGDQIYAVIRGIGGSSDGKGKGITAPNPRGQKHALKRAYEDAGFGPRSVSLIEAHGTSTPVGDPVEVNSLREVLDADGGEYASDSIRLGSVKSMIGHLKSAAAAASMVKVAYALRDKVLPPTLNVETPNPKIDIDSSPFQIQTETEEWRAPGEAPRRAGVSAFGFGGTNFHVVVEEYDPDGSARLGRGRGGKVFSTGGGSGVAQAKSEAPSDGIVAFSGDSIESIREQFQTFAARFETDGMAATLPYRLPTDDPGAEPPTGSVRLAVVYTSREELDERIPRAARGLKRNKGWRVLSNQGVYFSDEQIGGDVAMLFPGQGSQYLHMAGDLRERFPVVDQTVREADEIMDSVLDDPLSSIIFPDLDEVSEGDAFHALSQTEITQPAVLTVDVALFRLLGELGVHPDMVAGHSLGEYGACVAAGVMSFPDALRTVAARGTEMSKATPMNGDPGLMAGVNASVEDVQNVLEEIDGYVVCANKNCPTQTIIAGLTDAVQDAVKRFEAMDLDVVLLPVSHAFHSKVVSAASKPLRNHLEKMDIHVPETPILTNVTGDFYPETPAEIRDLLAEQVAAPVEFIREIERMYDEGARVFVEVGPKRAQTSFVSSILEGRPHLALYTNHPKKGDFGSFYDALAELWSNGVWGREALHIDAPVDVAAKEGRETTPDPQTRATLDVTATGSGSSLAEIRETLLDALCEKTGYDPDEIEFDFELEADLGVDTVKQAEIMAAVREEFGLPKDDEFRLAEYPTLDHLADYVVEKVGGVPGDDEPVAETAASASTGPSREAILDVMLDVLCEKTGYDPDEIEFDFELEADLGVDTVKQAEIMAAVREEFGLPKDDEFRLAEYPTLDHLADYVVEKVGGVPGDDEPVAETAGSASTGPSREAILDVMLDVLCEKTGYDPDEIEFDFELEADLGVDTVKQAEIMAAVREEFGLPKDDEFRLAEYPTLNALADYVVEKVGAPAADAVEAQTSSPDPTPDSPPSTETLPEHEGTPHRHEIDARIVVSGCALGLPGLDELFDEDAVDALLGGKNMIGDLTDEKKEAMVSKRITRLIKHDDGHAEMKDVTDPEEVIKLAGQAGSFELDEWDVPERLQKALDTTSQMAFAAGLTALKDAGLPLVPRYRETRNGKKITTGWTLPKPVGEETGVIFATAFAGEDALVEELNKAANDEDYQFNHRFLLRVLGMANARFAEYVGARGPNTKINNACASTTTAMALAEDWIKAGRCKRVIILGADNASGDEMMEWIGSGFLATGAATTEGEVEDAALPFDRRRHGIIVGMGAVSIVMEEGGLPEARGIEPIADLLGTRICNSALHPTRLDVDHISSEVGQLIGQVEGDFRLDRSDVAGRTVFVSHETYSPRRGGSAQTEIESLRRTFGEHANEVVIANTKGFTGHAMGAGIEDVLALKSLQREHLPHIANFEEPDPDLGDLRLSEGGDYELDYALRLAAGFGSQLALAFFRHRARTEDRVYDEDLYTKWLREVSGFDHPDLTVEHRTLRLREGEPKETQPEPEKPTQTPARPAPPAKETPKPPPVRARREPTPAAATTSSEPASPEDFERQAVLVEAHTAATFDLAGLRERLNGKNVVILAGPMLVTDLMHRAAQRCGSNVHVIGDSHDRSPLDADISVCDMTDEAAIRREFDGIGDVDGIINLLGFGMEGFHASDVYDGARRSFHAARTWMNTLGGAPSADQFFITVTGMGGRLGFDRATGPLPVCGAVTGFTKALGREWEDAAVRVVDVAREGFYPDLGLQVLAQAFAEDGQPEVGLIGGVRYVPTMVDAEDILPGDAASLAPASDDVIVVTGGAKGITAEVALDLADRFGCRLALVGRTTLEHPDPLSIDLDAEKRRIKAEMKAAGERVTPVKVGERLWSFESQRTIGENMERMRQAGSDVEYFSCDVADAESVSAMIDDVRDRFGAVTGVIHGAGVEESRLIGDKDVEGFDRVFRGKALGGLNLWAAVKPDAPRFFIGFSSVAGRFGNPGQVDYSSANEVLNKLTALINATSDTKAISIDWTAWDEVGMAAEGSMRTLLEHRGVQLLPPSIGAPMVGDILESGYAGEFVVAGELGDFGDTPSITDRPEDDRDPAPLVGRVIERTDDRMVVERTFSLDYDHFLADHVYEGTPVVPGVMGYELMVEAARAVTGAPITVVEDVEFDRAIKLHRNEPVRLIATAERDGDVIRARVESTRTSKTGRKLEQTHFRAVVTPGETADAERSRFVIDPSQSFLEGPNKVGIYKRYFHTGLFEVLEDVPFVGDDTIIGYGRVPTGALTEGYDNREFSTDPMVREMAFQTAGLWGMYHNRMSYLPLAIERSEQFSSPEPGQRVCIRCKTRDDASEHAIAFDVEVLDEEGRRLQVMEKVELIGHRKLLDDESFDPFPRRHISSLRMSGPEAEALLADRGLGLEDITTPTERKAYDRLISQRRRTEWLAARVATKELVSGYLRDFFGLPASIGDVVIEKDENKAPHLALRGPLADALGGLPLPHLSITHSAGVAIAAITGTGAHARIGIDLEQVEARDASFAHNYFSPRELELSLDGDAPLGEEAKLAVLWSLKEAISKALGLGLQLKLDEVTVTALQENAEGLSADVDLSGEAARVHREYGGEPFDIHVIVDGKFALSSARLPVNPSAVHQVPEGPVDLGDGEPMSEKEMSEQETMESQGPDDATGGGRRQMQLAAVAALLEHKGLLPRRGTKERKSITRDELPSWKSE